MKSKTDIKEIQRIVGPITEEQLRFVDAFVFEDVGLFLPVAGPCYYSLSPEHTHPSYLIVYSFKGEGEGWVQGIKQSALKPGEYLLLPPDIKHQEMEGGDTPSYLAICIMPKLFESVASEYGVEMDELRRKVMISKAQKQFLPLCWQFIAEASSSYTQNSSLLKAISIQLCHSIIRSAYDTQAAVHSSEWRIEIGQSIAFIHSHLHEKIGLEDIANSALMSVPNFSRVFKKEMNLTAIEYLHEQRLYKAQKMLQTDEFSMLDIASLCGFSSVSYFSTSFKKRYKMSPEKYKQQMNGRVVV